MIWFERPPFNTSLSSDYPGADLLQKECFWLISFLSAEAVRCQSSSQPHRKHFSLNGWDGALKDEHRANSDYVLRIHPATMISPRWIGKAILQRELWRITRGILVFSIRWHGLYQTSSFFIIINQLCNPTRLDQGKEAGSWSNITLREKDLQVIQKIDINVESEFYQLN